MIDNNSTQLAMRICREFAQLYRHGCVWHGYFLDLSQFCFDSGNSGWKLNLRDA